MLSALKLCINTHYLSLSLFETQSRLASIARSHLVRQNLPRSCQNPGKYFWLLSEFPPRTLMNNSSFASRYDFRELFIIHNLDRARAGAYARMSPSRGRKRREESSEPHVYVIESGNLVRLTSFPGLLLCSWAIDTRALARAHARFTAVFSSFVREWRINGGPFHYSRRHSGSTRYRDVYTSTAIGFATRIWNERQFSRPVLGRHSFAVTWNNNDNGVSSHTRIVRAKGK